MLSLCTHTWYQIEYFYIFFIHLFEYIIEKKKNTDQAMNGMFKQIYFYYKKFLKIK